MQLRFDGRSVIVTGGSKGIGRAVATAFADAGGDVLIVSRKAEQLAATADEINARAGEVGPGGAPARRGRVAWCVANAGDSVQAEAAVARAVEEFGRVDVLVNNAATNPYHGDLLGLDEARAAKTVQVNQWALVRWTQLVHAAWMGEHGGAVCNVSSVGGMSVEAHIGYYNATKAAVLHLTRQLAAELGPRVRVNAVAPGLVRTDMARALWEADEERITSRWPLRRLGEPEDVAGAVLFLCSDAASYITGTSLVVDGGAIAGPALS